MQDWEIIRKKHNEVVKLKKEIHQLAIPKIHKIVDHSQTLPKQEAMEYLDAIYEQIPDIPERSIILGRINKLYLDINPLKPS